MSTKELKELTIQVQSLVGISKANQDGVWGSKTAKAVLDHLTNTSGGTEIIPPSIPEESEDARVHRLCNEVLNVFESGSREGNYADITIYKDGGNGAYRQITYGKAGSTQDGTLDSLLSAYVEASQSTMARDIAKQLPIKNKRHLVDDKAFIATLRKAGADPVMKTVQDKIFDEHYWKPAMQWAAKHGFVLPLSKLIIFDSFIHSGGILDFLRKRFSALPPSKGGVEQAWCKAYVDVRKKWLSAHTNKVLRATVYRMYTMQTAIAQSNWDLKLPINANGTVVK